MTLYFYGTVSGYETVWNGSGGTDYGNWFTAHVANGDGSTIPASALPTSSDDVVLLTDLTDASYLSPTSKVKNVTIGSPGIPVQMSAVLYNNAGIGVYDVSHVTGDIHCDNVIDFYHSAQCYNNNIYCSLVRFYNDSQCGAVVHGVAKFYDSSWNTYGEVLVGAEFYNFSKNGDGGIGIVRNSALFSDQSQNHGTVIGAAYFQDGAFNYYGGIVYGTTRFEGGAINFGTINYQDEADHSVTLVTFSATDLPNVPYNDSAGVINGIVEFNNNTHNDGTVNGHAIFTQGYQIYGIVNGTALFNGEGANNGLGDGQGSVNGHAIFENGAINYGYVRGIAAFKSGAGAVSSGVVDGIVDLTLTANDYNILPAQITYTAYTVAGEGPRIELDMAVPALDILGTGLL